MRFGKTLVVEEADSIEPLMYPLLTGDMQGQGSSSSVKIGDRIVDYNKDFRLMLVTRNSRPQLAVDAAALLCLVNFTVTRWADSSQQLVELLQVVIHTQHASKHNTIHDHWAVTPLLQWHVLCGFVSLGCIQELTSTPMPCRSGLEGLLLGLSLQAEQPQLESQRTALLQQEEEQRLQLAALDTQVLQSLATSKASS